jgi:DNA polymerase III delta prime subunit
MTKNAQQALRYLLQNYSSSVRFCLICNYISRIDEGLQNEFLRLRFNQLPENDIITFLKNISQQENLHLQEKSLQLIQKLYKSDIRSMINFMQSNQNILDSDFHIIDDSIWQQFFTMLQDQANIKSIPQYLQEISQIYNMDKKNIIKNFMNYIIRNKKDVLTSDFLNFVENIMHYQECKNTHYIHYSISRLSTFLEKSS